MPILDLTSIPEHKGSSYPSPFDKKSADRIRQRLGDAGGLTQFGVNRLQLPPGAWSSQRHWHSAEDEVVYVISGEVVLITDRGEEALRAGDCAAFPKDVPNGHHLINKSSTTPCVSKLARDWPTISPSTPTSTWFLIRNSEGMRIGMALPIPQSEDDGFALTPLFRTTIRVDQLRDKRARLAVSVAWKGIRRHDVDPLMPTGPGSIQRHSGARPNNEE